MKKITFAKKRIIIWILVGILGLTSIFFGIQFGKLSHMTSMGNAGGALEKAPQRGKFNVLLLGVDEDGVRADTIMIFSVDNINNTVKVLSIPRDTRITLNTGKSIKINSCLGFESREKFMVETIKTITKMPIHYYCEVNFDGFIKIIDILGGVDYDVPYDMNYDDPAQDLHIHLKAGPQHLDGQAAHDFVRFRHNNKGEGVYAPGEYAQGDIGRIAAQQNFIKEVFRQKMQPQYLLKAVEIIDAAYTNVRTNFSVSSALDFVNILKSTDTTELESFVLPGEGKYIGKVSYYVYSPSDTKELILKEFGYPEDEAAKLDDEPAESEVVEEEKPEETEEPEQEKTPATVIN
ncbi:MAG: LCP family protein [Clostridia bacterium]|nr:LCP family protein [Clostridia bacterium]